MLATPGRAAITDGLVSYWPLDFNNAGSASDLSFGNNLAISGAPTVSAGMFSNAFTLGGTAYLTNAFTYDNNDTGLPIYGARSYTVALWVKGAAQTGKYIYAEGNTTNNNPLFIIQTGNVAGNNGKLDVILRNTRNVNYINHAITTNVVFDNTWHHIAFVDDRGAVSIYVDGALDPASFSFSYVQRADKSGVDINTAAIGTLLRATAATGNVFAGQVDEVATWERALSQLEVNQVRTNGVYTQGTPVPARPVTLSKVPADLTKKVGDWNLLSVDPGGNRPLSYQWYKNGSPIGGGTQRDYFVANLQVINSGDYYSCAVTNPTGFAVTTNATFTVPNDPTPNATNGLVNYWPLDVFDASTNSAELHFAQNMVMVGMDTNFQVSAGQFSNSVFFLASNPTYGYRQNGSAIYNATNYSISMWVQGLGNQTDRRVFSEGFQPAYDVPLFSLGTDNSGTSPSIYPFVRGTNNVSSPLTLRLSTRPVFDGNWHHVVWTDANGDAKLYVDGVLDETDYKYNRPAMGTLNQTSIGGVLRTTFTANTAFTGSIDEVATWNRVLTWTEIQQIMTNGVPSPGEVILPPVVTSQPANRTNNIFVGQDASFSVGVNGSAVLYYQWSKNGSPISGLLNDTAVTSTLTLTNVQLVDSNTTYSVVITNASGSVTSSVARLYVLPVVAATNGEVFKVDVGLANSANIQPGFDEFTQLMNPASFGTGAKLTFTGIGAALSDRNRTAGLMAVNSPPLMNQAQIYNDFIYANNMADGTGLSILIQNLATNYPYGLTVWSFDPQSPGVRFADWAETSSGSPIIITNGYSWDGNILPTADYQNTFGGLLTSSSTGTLELQGLNRSGTNFAVFVNALRLVANPVATGITQSAVVGGNLQITTETEYAGMTPNIEQTSDVANGPWVPAVGGVIISSVGPVVVVEFSINPTTNMFYRGKRKP